MESPQISMEKKWSEKRAAILKRVKASVLLTTLCSTLLTSCPGEYAYASDSCVAAEAAEESLPEELIEITGKDESVSRGTARADTTKPTVDATLSGSVITVIARDSESGIQKITVNGADYTTFTEDGLLIQLTQSDFSTEQFVFTATDEAGNVSERYVMDNPYYNWPSGGSSSSGVTAQGASGNTSAGTGTGSTGTTVGSSGASATTTVRGTTAGNTGTGTASSPSEGGVSSPLPQTAEATKPTEATGTVIDRSGTAAKAVEASGEEVTNVTQTAQNGSKGFYTIQTKSGKTFYLIIDNDQSSDNVYLLTEVSEQDLLNFNLPDTVTLPDAGTVRAEPEKKASATPKPTKAVTEKPEEPEMPEKRNPLVKNILLALLIAGVGGAAYYFKVYKPKQEDMYDDDDDEEDEAAEYEREDEEPPETETMEEEE